MTVKRIQQVVDLDGAGYVEEEFFVSGSGNAYDWAQDGSLSVVASGLPYTTRVMVRRPVDVSRFSGYRHVPLPDSPLAGLLLASAPDCKSGEHGDFYAVLQIVTPSVLSEREKALYRELAQASTFDPRAHFE